MSEQPDYPESEKWRNWYDGFVSIHGFMEWLGYAKGISFGEYPIVECWKCKGEGEIVHKDGPPWVIECPNCEGLGNVRSETMNPVFHKTQELYYEYAGIDGNKLESERRMMLEKMREMNQSSTPLPSSDDSAEA